MSKYTYQIRYKWDHEIFGEREGRSAEYKSEANACKAGIAYIREAMKNHNPRDFRVFRIDGNHPHKLIYREE